MSVDSERKTILIVTQTFLPDPASVGQHMADVAQEMARRGHRVVVLTANRGYENPRIKYPTRENWNGVEIRRIRFSSFGRARFSFVVWERFRFSCSALCGRWSCRA